MNMNAGNKSLTLSSGLLSLSLTLMAVMVVTMNALAAPRVNLPPIPNGVTGVPYRGTMKPSMRFDCQGYPTLITTDEEGNTQVYVNDGTAPTDKGNTRQEYYRVKDDINWAEASLVGGGKCAVVGNDYCDVSITMDGGCIREIILSGRAGYSIGDDYETEYTDHVVNARLDITGGEVFKISTLLTYDCAIEGTVVMNLSNMTYTGSDPIDNYSFVTIKEKDDNYIYTYFKADVFINIDPSCTFLCPELSPYYEEGAENNCMHQYRFKEIIPDDCIVEAGEAIVECKLCHYEWPKIRFNLVGDTGESVSTGKGYYYYVTLKDVIVPPTCQPGRAIYKLNMSFHFPFFTDSNVEGGEYETVIPAIAGVHNWGADGVCHEEHYQVRYNNDNAADGVMLDANGNIVFALDESGQRVKDDTEYRAPSLYLSYVSSEEGYDNRYYKDEEGKTIKTYFGNLIPLYEWNYKTFGSGQIEELYKYAVDARARFITIGFGADYHLTNGFFPLSYDMEVGTYVNLHGHTLDGTIADDETRYVMFNPSSRQMTFLNGSYYVDLMAYTIDGTLTLDNAKLYSKNLNREWDKIYLRNHSALYLFPGYNNTLNPSKVTVDATSHIFENCDYYSCGDIDQNGVTDQDDIDKIVGVLLRKGWMPEVVDLYDIDGDGRITVADVVGAICIMNGDAEAREIIYPNK